MKYVNFNSTGMWVDSSFYDYTKDKEIYHFLTLTKFLSIDKEDCSILLPEEPYTTIFSEEWEARVYDALTKIKEKGWNISAMTPGNEIVWQKRDQWKALNGNIQHEIFKFYERFCEVTSRLIKLVFPGMPVCVNRTAGSIFKDHIDYPFFNQKFGNELSEITAQYSDFLCFNVYRHWAGPGRTSHIEDARKLLDNIAKKYDTPYLVTECTYHDKKLTNRWFHLRYRRERNCGYPAVFSQEDRGKAFLDNVKVFEESAYCLGIHWYSYLDHVSKNWGLRDTVTNRLYKDFVDYLHKHLKEHV